MITTDTGAKKIEGTDNWRQIFGAHNDTVDAYDANIEALQDALGIVVNGNQSAVSASSGQFIILKNSSIVDSGDDLLPDGLYTAAKAIPANTVIDKTYLTADAAGGLNALNGKLELFPKFAKIVGTTPTNGNSSTVAYPSGFSQDSFIVSVMVKYSGLDAYISVDNDRVSTSLVSQGVKIEVNNSAYASQSYRIVIGHIA